ncbi:MAG: T9SS type A sorting domain-containing protein [Ignavibacteriae bacterium]|nr:T9SS type A sorting domain-containing protein [Ignavibacteriota bacterium]
MPNRLLLFLCFVAVISLPLSSIAQERPDDPRWNIRSSTLLQTGETSTPAQQHPAFVPNTKSRRYDTPLGTMLVEPNVRPRANTGYHQSEVNIATHPLNRNIMFGASHNITTVSPLKINVATFITTNAGQTWYGFDTLADYNTQRGDPAPMIDKDGVFIYGHLNSTANFGSVTGMGMNRSTNMGITFEPTIPITNAGGSDADKNALGTDDIPTSAHYGNSYMAWTKFTAGNTPAVILVTRTTDHGVSWSSATQVNTAASGTFSQGTDVAVGTNGDAYICWVEESTTSPYPSRFIGFAKSTDGGVTWTYTNTAYATSGMRSSSYNGWAVRVNDFPRMAIDKSGGGRRGWIYVVAAEQNLAPAGTDADIVMHISTDGGTTWGAGIRVNQDPLNNGKKQFFPSICVDQGGGINVAYYDNRDYAASGDSCEVWMSRSIDGGLTWTDIQASDHAFRPKNVPGVNSMGDYMGITAGNGKVWPMWMDDRSGFYDIWTAGISVADPIDPMPPGSVSAFSDYSTPTSMRLNWTRPTTLVNGDPIGPYVMRIKRNGVQIAERPSTDSTFIDTGLTDGTTYTYVFQTRLTANDSLSNEMQVIWVAGGAKTSASPTNLAVTGTSASGYKLKWKNPSRQTDGTRLDDFVGIRIYRDGSLVSTLTRTVADTARNDSTTDSPAAGFHTFQVTAIDNENPVNESGLSNTGQTPLDLPFNDAFATAGAPDVNRWVATGVDINDLGQNEPSSPYSLNLNGSPTSNTDNIDSRPFDLTGRQGQGLAISYLYQPGGTSDRPEVADSLILEFQNSNGVWVTVRKYPGIASTTPIPDFAFEAVGVDGIDPQGGSFFFNGFKFRFRSRGTAGTSDDDWFVDDVFFGIPTGSANLAATGVISPAGQVSNNVALNPVIRVLNASAVQAGVYTVNVNITGPGTTYNATQTDSNLAAGATRNVPVSTAFTPNAVGQWNVKAWTRLTGDPNPANDTTTSTFYAVNPLTMPVQEAWPDSGLLNPLKWTNVNARVNADATGEPSEPFALNLSGNPTAAGLDTVTSLTINLSGRAGQNVTLAYWQQPQGTGEVPDAADSLVTEALNDQGGWVVLGKLPGAAVRPFAFVRFNLDSVSAGGGSFFHSGFKFRFRSRSSSTTTTRQDDWFVDDIFLGIPNTIPLMVVSPQTVADTVLVGQVDSTSYVFNILNNNPFATGLSYTIAETPAVNWLAASPASGSVNGGTTSLIHVAVNFTGQTAGNYTTRLLVSGNDPGNAVDTVTVNFRVNQAPVVSTNPDSFFFVRNSGDSATAQLKVRNTGLGPLTYSTTISGAYAGYAETNIGAATTSLATSSALMRGGVVDVTSTVQLNEIRSWLTITIERELRWVVYENTSGTSYTKIFESVTASSGTGGPLWYSSGPVNLVLQAGKKYAIGVDWPAVTGSGLTYHYRVSSPVPEPISFGNITGGLALSAFPPAPTISVSQTNTLYYTQLVTSSGKWLSITSNQSGTVAPGDSAAIGFKVNSTGLVQGTNLGALAISSNDPVKPIVSVPVRLDVLTGVDELETGIPLEFSLAQNYPNPFNPSTTIRFGLPEQATVSLKIYNLLGQQIATLAEGEMPAAYHRVVWNGRNSAGAQVATGMYFYRFEATGASGEKFNSLKKLILLK